MKTVAFQKVSGQCKEVAPILQQSQLSMVDHTGLNVPDGRFPSLEHIVPDSDQGFLAC